MLTLNPNRNSKTLTLPTSALVRQSRIFASTFSWIVPVRRRSQTDAAPAACRQGTTATRSLKDGPAGAALRPTIVYARLQRRAVMTHRPDAMSHHPGETLPGRNDRATA